MSTHTTRPTPAPVLGTVPDGVPGDCRALYERIQRAGLLPAAQISDNDMHGIRRLLDAKAVSYHLAARTQEILGVRAGGTTTIESDAALTRGPMVKGVTSSEQLLFDEIKGAGGRLAVDRVRMVESPTRVANALVRRGLIRREVIVPGVPPTRTFALDDEFGSGRPPAQPEALVIEPRYANAVLVGD